MKCFVKLVTECCLKERETKINFCRPNPLLLIKVLSKWKFYAALLSCIHMVSLNRHHLPLNPETYGWKKEDDFWVPVWFERNALPTAEELTAISLESLKLDHQKLEKGLKMNQTSEIARTKNVLSGDEPWANSDIDLSSFDIVLQWLLTGLWITLSKYHKTPKNVVSCFMYFMVCVCVCVCVCDYFSKRHVENVKLPKPH